MRAQIVRALSLLLVAAAAGACGGSPEGPAAAGTPTFTRDVAPILFEHCAGCHQPNGSAPFSLLDYASVRPRADAIAQATANRAMPPWLPASDVGRFAGARGLTEEQIGTIGRWAAQGAPEGRAADLPPAPALAGGWQLGEPDLVVAMPGAYTLEAGDTDIFRNFVIPVPTQRTRYVRTIEIRPGSPRIIHHALVGVDEMRSSRRRDAADPGLGFSGMSLGDASMPDGSLLGWTPGMVPFPGVPGMAWRLPPRSDLVLQLHMLPHDEPRNVQAEIGIHFAETTQPGDPAYVVILDADEQLDIPLGDADFTVTDTMELPVDVEVLAVYPHAHYIGKQLEGWAELPDGSTVPLIRIDRWDFKWQDSYRYVEPVALPRGTVVGMRWTFDNSPENPHQVNDPPRRVTAGNRSSDEMAHLQLQMRVRTPTDRAMLQEAHYAHMLAKSPDNAPLLYAIGGTLRDQGRFAEAAERYEAAIAIQSEYVPARINLGAVLMALGRPDDAVAQLRAALQYDPLAAGAHYNLGLVFSARGELDDAARHYRDAIAAAPDYAEAHNNLGQVLATQGRLPEAAEHLRQALRLLPDAAEIHNNLGQVLGSQGSIDQAIRHFQEAVRLQPDGVEGYANLGTGLYMQGRLTEAAAHFRRALEIDPQHPRALEGLRATAQAR